MYREKLDTIIAVLKDDEDALDIIKAVIENAVAYVEKVTVLEGILLTARYISSMDDYRSKVESADSDRSLAHNALINKITILNRLCEQNDLPKLYEGDLGIRRDIGEFAGELVNELFVTRR